MNDLNKNEKERYSRQLILAEVGTEGQLKLKNANVLVIGAGGLGCPLLQYLTAVGVGKIGIVDGDVVERSNLARQILFTENDLGKNKALVAREKLCELNSEISIEAFPEFLNVENAMQLFQEYDIIADGSDNFE
jgi:adenylyltransferase/sulfurtransferase